VFGNSRRRAAIHYLKQCDTDTEITLSDLSTQVAAWEHGVDPDELDYEERRSVHISLYQSHIPRMDDVGLIDFDQEHNIITLTETGEEIDVCLRKVTENETPWPSYFLGLATVDAGAVGFATTGVVSWSNSSVAIAVAVTFFVSSLIFWYCTRDQMHVKSDANLHTER
jgi:hypothetical protein